MKVLEAVLRLDPAQRASAQTVLGMVEEWYAGGDGDRGVQEKVQELALRRRDELERFLERGAQ